MDHNLTFKKVDTVETAEVKIYTFIFCYEQMSKTAECYVFHCTTLRLVGLSGKYHFQEKNKDTVLFCSLTCNYKLLYLSHVSCRGF